MAETFSGTVKITKEGASPPTTVEIHGKDGTLILGGGGDDGDLRILDKKGKTRFDFSGGNPDSASDPGRFLILDNDGKTRFSFSSDKAEFVVMTPDGKTFMRIDGQKGNLTLGGADAAEDFQLADAEDVPLGSVMVLTDDGCLRAATHPYDTRVAGVLSGAGDCRPGLVLGRGPGEGARRLPIALVGKTFCRADATNAPIRVGDLLTTSAMRGHAMRATDARRAFGATIGKALRPLDGGTGLVPILVALQ